LYATTSKGGNKGNNSNNKDNNNSSNKRPGKPNSNQRSVKANTNTGSSAASASATVAANDVETIGQQGGPNWMEPTAAADTYDVGLHGSSFQIGSLAQRLYQALSSRSTFVNNKENVATVKAVAMELAAHQVVRVAMEQNGLELYSKSSDNDDDDDDDDVPVEYDTIESIQIVPSSKFTKNALGAPTFTTWADAANAWNVDDADSFDFLLRGVKARQKRLTTQDLLRSLDPDGTYMEQAMQAGIDVPTDENELVAEPTNDDHDNDSNENGGDDDEDDQMALLPQPQSLSDMAQDNIRRRELAPVPAVAAEQAFAGTSSRGYRPLSAQALSSTSLLTTDNENTCDFTPTVMHVMDALVSHGCLVVDVTDDGVHMDRAVVLATMWQAAEDFFQRQDDTETDSDQMPQGMVTAAETGSSHAKVGYASYDNGNMQFLETRLERSSGMLLPEQARTILGTNSCKALQEAFGLVASASKDIVRLTVAASSVETGAMEGDAASKAALLLANELVDDGRSLPASTNVKHAECLVSMSPHRLCRYSNNDASDKKKTKGPTREVFGAHTDSTFITAVPVAAVAGLEVYDEAAEQWYRPEKATRQHWQHEQKAAGKDPEALTETTADGVEVPWHARYIVMMPGELLQLATRSEVPAAVHRVVATEGKASRLSAPILLRGRSGVTLDIARYMGSTGGDPLLDECSGMTIEQIHDAMQPSSQ
jgi:hypothetical protein